jgi:hypothetical protein
MQFPSYLRRHPRERARLHYCSFERANDYAFMLPYDERKVAGDERFWYLSKVHLGSGRHALVLVETSWSLLVLITPRFPCAGKQATPGRARG